MSLPRSGVSNGAAGSGIQESMPFKSLTPSILQGQYRHRHKAACAFPGDEPDHAERTAKMWKPIRPMVRSAPRTVRRRAERQPDSPWTSGGTLVHRHRRVDRRGARQRLPDLTGDNGRIFGHRVRRDGHIVWVTGSEPTRRCLNHPPNAHAGNTPGSSDPR